MRDRLFTGAPARPRLTRLAGALGAGTALQVALAVGAPALPAGLLPDVFALFEAHAAPAAKSGAAPVTAPLRAADYLPSSKLDVRPGIMTRVEPEYPERAARRFLSGTVRIRVFINERGTVDRVIVVKANPPGFFEDSAERAFTAARFSPGMKDGRAVKTQLLLEVDYESPPPPKAPGGRS